MFNNLLKQKISRQFCSLLIKKKKKRIEFEKLIVSNVPLTIRNETNVRTSMSGYIYCQQVRFDQTIPWGTNRYIKTYNGHF